MDQAAAIVWTLIAVVFLLLMVLVWAARALVSVKREMSKLNKTIRGLEARVGEQERQMSQIQAALSKQGGGDLFEPFVEAFKSLKSKGWVSALTLLGSHLVRSYLGSRRRKSLPSKQVSEKEQ